MSAARDLDRAEEMYRNARAPRPERAVRDLDHRSECPQQHDEPSAQDDSRGDPGGQAHRGEHEHARGEREQRHEVEPGGGVQSLSKLGHAPI